jgi:gluconate kinase
LLESQLATLEHPTPDERVIRFDIADPVSDIAKQASHWLLAQE